MSASDDNGPPLFELTKRRTTILVRKRRYKDAEFPDIREYVNGESAEGTATGKGVTIPLARAGELYGLAKALIAFADENGPTGLRIAA